MKEVGFLGVVIGLERIKMEEEKVKDVLDWLTPKCVKLYNMVKKDQKWDWMEKQEKAFRELKERFTKKPVLVVPDLDKKMRIEVDVSDYATGGVLLMECEDGLW